MGDFVAIITSFCARLYGRRRAKGKTEQVLAALQQNGASMSQKPGKADAQEMNAYLYASNLAHIPQQIAWATAKRGMAAHTVPAAYSSQECSRCHYVDRANRPNQQTFCCVVCGYRDHADHNGSLTLASRHGDRDLAAYKNRGEIKALLMRRHEEWKQKNRLAVVQPPVQLGLWASSEASTDVG